MFVPNFTHIGPDGTQALLPLDGAALLFAHSFALNKANLASPLLSSDSRQGREESAERRQRRCH